MNKREITKALRNLNKLYKMLGTWQEVANRVGVNRATINKWFAGTRRMSRVSSIVVTIAMMVSDFEDWRSTRERSTR